MEQNTATLLQQHEKNFTKPSIRIGTITVLLAMVGSFLPNIYLYLAFGIWPGFENIMSSWGTVAIAFGAFYIVEPVSYFPVFGLSGTYIGILSGNISQIRLPAASTAQDVVGAKPGTPKGEVVAILAICGSVVTNIIFLTVAVVAGSTLLSFLPAVITQAMADYILPSLFGACFASMAVKKFKIALYALPIALILLGIGAPAWISIVASIFGTIIITYFLYKKKIVT